jgi:long-chain acyl-CoA synthetase
MEYTYDAEKFIDVFEKNFTWLNGYMRNVRRFRDEPALIDPIKDELWTYGKLNENVNRLANALKAHGVGKNDIVLYQLMNSPQFAFCYIAPHKLGAVNSPANFNLAAGETAKILSHHKPKAYFYDCDMRFEFWKALELSDYKPEVIVAVDYRGEKPELPEGHVFYNDFIEGFSTEEPETVEGVSIYSETTRLFTSGTTGLPKGVPVNNANEVLSAHDVIMHFPMGPTDVTMNTTPWFHRGGLHSGGLTPTLYAGGACVIMRMFSAKSCLEYSEKYGVTFIIGVPSVLNNLASRQEKHPTNLSRLKGIVTMGSPLEKNACIRYQKVLTPNIFNGYGTTESFWNSFLRPYDLPEMAGTAGRSCTDDDIRVINTYEDRKAEPDDVVPMDGKTTGEIIIRSYAKCSMSYIDNEELTEDKYHDGWLYTHDLGTWDDKQFISVSGRKDDMIICMGENIYPAQIEEVINQCPGVKDCIVTGVPDKSRGEAVAAYIVPEDESLTIQQVNKFCVEHDDLSVYKCPRYYAIVDSVPYNATGKKQHFVVKDSAEKDIRSGLLKRP